VQEALGDCEIEIEAATTLLREGIRKLKERQITSTMLEDDIKTLSTTVELESKLLKQRDKEYRNL